MEVYSSVSAFSRMLPWVYMCIFRPDKNMFVVFSQLAVPSLAVGIAFLINFFVGKNMLAKEMEAERDAKTSEKK